MVLRRSLEAEPGLARAEADNKLRILKSADVFFTFQLFQVRFTRF